MAGMKSDVKKFLKQNGISNITVNKKTLKLSQATYRNLVGEAVKLGYGKQ
ncbi:MAG: hypothetical protein WA079_09295 [Leuconostoc falkenbergense]